MEMLQGMKCACFVNVHTNVVMASKPSCKGKLVIESIDMISQGRVPFGRGFRVPAGRCVEILVRWHVGHDRQ